MSGFAAPGVLAASSKLSWCRRPRGYRPSGTPTASNRGTAADRIGARSDRQTFPATALAQTSSVAPRELELFVFPVAM